MFATSVASVAMLWAIGAAASPSQAAVYIHDPFFSPTQSSSQSTLDPIAARCVLAQRANVPQHHIKGLDRCLGGEAIAAINAYGVRTPLADAQNVRRATILLEGLEDDEDIPALSRSRQFLIDPTPSRSDARKLVIDLATHSRMPILDNLSESYALSALTRPPENTSSGDVFYITSSMEDLAEVWNRLVKEKVHISTISMPSILSTEAPSQWSLSSLHGAESLLLDHEPPIKRRSFAEKTVTHSGTGLLQNRQDSSYNGSLAGILPACFSSQSACESMTLNCTGHGSCVQKYSDNSDPSSGSSVKTCFTCQCRATTFTNSQGQTQTTYWGGPACQKRDISSPFWLLALFTVGMVFLIGFAVGQIWTMGEEELPSVIGAGVSGPVKRS